MPCMKWGMGPSEKGSEVQGHNVCTYPGGLHATSNWVLMGKVHSPNTEITEQVLRNGFLMWETVVNVRKCVYVCVCVVKTVEKPA